MNIIQSDDASVSSYSSSIRNYSLIESRGSTFSLDVIQEREEQEAQDQEKNGDRDHPVETEVGVNHDDDEDFQHSSSAGTNSTTAEPNTPNTEGEALCILVFDIVCFSL